MNTERINSAGYAWLIIVLLLRELTHSPQAAVGSTPLRLNQEEYGNAHNRHRVEEP